MFSIDGANTSAKSELPDKDISAQIALKFTKTVKKINYFAKIGHVETLKLQFR